MLEKVATLRELLTKLAFQFDRTNLDRFERSIIGFKTKFSVAAAAIGTVFKKTIDHFADFSKTILDVDELARSTGVATERFVALDKAASQFRIPDFSGAFLNLSKILDDARHGAGELFEIFRRSGHQLNLTPFVETNDIEGAIKAILNYGKSLKDVREQTKLFSDVFGDQNAAGFVNVVKQGTDALSIGADSNMHYARSLLAMKDQARDTELEIKNLYTEINVLTNHLTNFFIPAVTQTIGGLNDLIKDAKKANESGGIGETFKFLGRATADAIMNDQTGLFGIVGQLGKFFESILGNENNPHRFNPKSTIERYFPDSTNNNSSSLPIINNTNNFDFRVDAGTTEQQGIQISDMVRLAIQNTWQEQVREIVSNNPVVE